MTDPRTPLLWLIVTAFCTDWERRIFASQDWQHPVRDGALIGFGVAFLFCCWANLAS